MPRFTRSANIERDRITSTIDGYVPTVRVLELLERITEDLEQGTGGAYSIIGPYGSGKSSAALFLQALLGPNDQPLTTGAFAKLRKSNGALAKRFSRARLPWRAGFVAAAAAAQREPVATTVLRALRGVRPRIKRLSTEVELGDWLTNFAADQPLLLVLDEFGKNLEFFAERPADSDLYLLQQLAERAVDPQAPPLFVLTLQHLAFEEYLSLSTPTVQREWAKIQGRFADVPFAETPRQVRRLIASALGTSKDEDLAAARRHFNALERLSLGPVIDDPEEVLAVYPLHPLSVVALPELCARFAQNERTLFSFLRSNDPHSVPYHLNQRQASTPDGRYPRLKLDGLYDYFVESARSQLMAARGARRWLEIEGRIRDAAPSLSPRELQVLKSVGILNLVSAGGALRASGDVLAYACSDEPDDKHAARFVSEALEKFTAQNILTFRQFADEYRVWFGSDFDLSAAFDDAKRDIEGKPLAALLESVVPRSALVAGQFTVATGVLRSFECRYADQYSDLTQLQPSNPVFDGLLALWVGDRNPVLNANSGPRPTVLAVPKRARALKGPVTEVAAYRRILERSLALKDDWVARREVIERLVLAEQRLEAEMWSAFEAESSQVEYHYLAGGPPVQLQGGRATSVISAAAALAYSQAPVIRNEVIGRQELTSQGAAARRDLVEALVDRTNEEGAGLTGYGPEYAIYVALLREPGIHGVRAGRLTLAAPKNGHSLRPVWDEMERALEQSHFKKLNVSELLERVSRPPYGLRQGPFFVLFPALLLARQQDLAVYEQAAFQPTITADLFERMAKNPEKFEIRSFALQKGQRLAALRACIDRFRLNDVVSDSDGRPRVLDVVRPLLKTYRILPDFAHHTKTVSQTAVKVREALTGAREPDQLLFTDLPAALGFTAFEANDGAGAKPDEFAEELARHLRELRDCYSETLGELRTLGAKLLGVPDQQFRQALRERSTPLVDHAGHNEVRSFLLAAVNTTLEDEAWFENLAMTLTNRAPKVWHDDDVTVFRANLRARIGALQRLEFLFDGVRDRAQVSNRYRICVTAADGTERTLTTERRGPSPELLRLAQRVLSEAEGTDGRGAGPELVRLLVEQLTRDDDAKASVS